MHPEMDMGSVTPLNENQMPCGDMGNDYYDSPGENHDSADDVKNAREQVVDTLNC